MQSFFLYYSITALSLRDEHRDATVSGWYAGLDEPVLYKVNFWIFGPQLVAAAWAGSGGMAEQSMILGVALKLIL